MPIRSLLIWGVVALVLVVLFSVITGGNRAGNAAELSYSDLLRRVEAGQIQSVETQGETLFASEKGSKQPSFVTYLPTGTMPQVVQRLDAAGVAVQTDRMSVV